MLTASHVSAQQVTGASRDALLTAAHSHYYNLRVAGVTSYRCNVKADWKSIFASSGGPQTAAQNSLLTYLSGLRVSISTNLNGKQDVSIDSDGVAPAEVKDRAQRVQDGTKQILSGFLTAWTPSLNGTFIAGSGGSLDSSGSGYVFSESDAGTTTTETLDKDMHLTHISVKSDALLSEMDTSFTQTSAGLVMTRMEGDSRQPVSAPTTHVAMATEFGQVDGVFLPVNLTVTIPNVLNMKFQFDKCVVEMAPKS